MCSVVLSWGFVMAKIFVVENDSSTQKFLKMLLGWQHHEIVGFATSADEAKTAIAVVQPDLCLIDVNLLSSESGIDVAEYVIEQFGLPVIIMSGDDYPTLPVPFVLKPVRSETDQVQASALNNRQSIEISVGVSELLTTLHPQSTQATGFGMPFRFSALCSPHRSFP